MKIFRKTAEHRLRQELQLHLSKLANAPVIAARENAHKLLAGFETQPGPHTTLGYTSWEQQVSIPLYNILTGHGLTTGSTGSGKTSACLLIVQAVIERLPYETNIGLGVIDPTKADLYLGTLWLLLNRLLFLKENDPQAYMELVQRIVIIDLGMGDPPSSYNILARNSGTDMSASCFASSRAELVLGLLPGDDHVSVAGVGLLEKLMQLLSELELPVIPFLNTTLADEAFRRRLLSACPNRSVAEYFSRDFEAVPKATVAALRRRISSLLSSDGVRLALSGLTAPDFMKLQDKGSIILIHFGVGVPRSIRELLHCLVVSDIVQSVFRRRRKESKFLWVIDEAQTLFAAPTLQDSLSDVQAMARSFGSHFLYITQNISTAVRDQRLLRNLLSNLRWSLSLRGEPLDCAFLKNSLPVTGRMRKPKTDPFTEPAFYSVADEREVLFNRIASLPDRTGYLYFRNQSAEAIKIRTGDLSMPADLDAAVESIRKNPEIGMRHTRQEYERLIAERDRKWIANDSDEPASQDFEREYRSRRWGKS
jgi:hypothetical protein